MTDELRLTLHDATSDPLHKRPIVGDARPDAAALAIRTFERGEAIFYQGDPCDGLLELTSGLVKLTQVTRKGREVVLRLAGPGDVLEPTFLDLDPRHGTDAHCVTDGVAIRTTWREDFLRAAEASPAHALSLARRLARQAAQVEAWVKLSKLSAAERVAWVLTWLAERFGVAQGAGWVVLDLYLTHEELATLTGTTRVTVTSCLGALRDGGLLKGTRGRYAVKGMNQPQPVRPPCLREPLPKMSVENIGVRNTMPTSKASLVKQP